MINTWNFHQTDPWDYNYVYDSINFGPGEVEKTHTVFINDDGVREEEEYFTLYLRSSSGTTTGTNYSARVTIVDNNCKWKIK